MIIPKTYGRMGNYLFQVATAIAYGLKHDIPFTVPTTTKDPKNNPIYLQHLANPDYRPNGILDRVVAEVRHDFREIPFEEEWRGGNIILDGYWQSAKYFDTRREQILNLFNYAWEQHDGLVSVHVRRGDYLRLTQKHPPVTKEWYERAMALFPDKRFRFFSDDIEWCKQNFRMRGDVSFSSQTKEEHDLIEMSCCEHHICSSSTFAWWGAWLNRNPDKQQVVIPERWFTPQEEARCNTSDIVPSNWRRFT